MTSLFLRIYISTLVFILASFFLIMFIANTFVYDNLLLEDSNTVFQTLSTTLGTKNTRQWQDEIEIYNELSSDFSFKLLDEKELSKTELQQLKEKGVALRDHSLGDVDLSVLYPLPNSSWFLKISEGDDSERTINDWIDLIIIFFVIFLTLAFGLYLLLRQMTKPIEHLSGIIEKIGQNDLTVKAKSNLPVPLNHLAESFNSMTAQLSTTREEQQVLIGAIPHELRSPLGKIRFALDLTRNKTTLKSLRSDIEQLDTYVDEMQQAVDEILELNRLQNQSKLEVSSFPLCNLLSSVTEQLSTENTNILLTLECKEFSTSANQALLKRAVQNLISNAQRHAKSKIQIKAWQQNQQTIIEVNDDGVGIPEDKLTEIFTPFSTLDSSRNRKTGGIGLGLAIVKLIMKKHQGQVSAERSTLGGARFELRW